MKIDVMPTVLIKIQIVIALSRTLIGVLTLDHGMDSCDVGQSGSVSEQSYTHIHSCGTSDETAI
jgi:hypothetical protein